MDNKQWFTSEVNNLLKSLKGLIDTYQLSRPLLIYSEVDKLMKLKDDYNKCDSNLAKQLIKKEMEDIRYELRNYSIFDDRFKEPYDDGK